MNLAEDMNGACRTPESEPGSISRRLLDRLPGQHGPRRGLRPRPRVRHRRGDRRRNEAAKETLLLAPCMNLLRHPLWGRAQETYGEDSFHIGRLASAMTVGVQQHIAANAKHFMAYDIEKNRALNNSHLPDEQTLREIYGRHFRMVVQDGGVASVMASYNLVNGTKSTQNHHTLTDVMRNDFGFKGFILSDWWAMPNVLHVVDTATLKSDRGGSREGRTRRRAAVGAQLRQLESIVTRGGGLTKADIDASAARILEQKFRFNADSSHGNVGLGTPKTAYVNSQIAVRRATSQPGAEGRRRKHGAAQERQQHVAHQPVRHEGGGPGRTTYPTQTTNNGVSSREPRSTSPLTSSQATWDRAVSSDPTGAWSLPGHPGRGARRRHRGDQIQRRRCRQDADFVVVIAGLTPGTRARTTPWQAIEPASPWTRNSTDVRSTRTFRTTSSPPWSPLGKPMVVVLEGGSVIDMPWLASVPAVVMAWYPGMVGGEALGQLLWGQANFGGKLPFTWGKQLSRLSDLQRQRHHDLRLLRWLSLLRRRTTSPRSSHSGTV